MKKCQVCNGPLGQYGVKFCGKKCSATGRTVRTEHACLCCGKLTKNAKFCSHGCASRITNQLRNCRPGPQRQDRPLCERCGEECLRMGVRFCSRGCSLGWPLHVKNKDQYIVAWLNGEVSGASTNDEQLSRVIIDYIRSLRGSAACWQCGWSAVNTVTGRIPTTIDHIDGNYTNNAVDNLRLLCPNCHSLTPTYGNLNSGNGRKTRRKKAFETYSQYRIK